MSKYLVLSADTNSEWDPAIYALLNVDVTDFGRLIHLSNIVRENPDIDYIGTYWHDIVFCNGDLERFLNQIVEMHNIERILEYPEQTLSMECIEISENSINFSSHGKHTGEEYWTVLSLDKIKELNDR